MLTKPKGVSRQERAAQIAALEVQANAALYPVPCCAMLYHTLLILTYVKNLLCLFR